MTAHNTEELLAQFHINQSVWVARLATSLIDPAIPHPFKKEFGATLAVKPGAAGVVMLPMVGQNDSSLTEHDEAAIWLRQLRARDILVWNMEADAEIDLAMLMRGYAPSFEPWWMTRDLTAPITSPRHLVRRVNALDIQQITESDVPYVIHDQLDSNRALINAPGDTQVVWLAAIVNDEPVGHCIVNITGDHAGLFNLGVSGVHRHRGIGTSLTLAAMQEARNLGATTMNLNSTPAGKRLYEQVGFRQFGAGQTWVRTRADVMRPTSELEQNLIHAIGTGDIANIHTGNIHRFQCNLSAQELAARFGQQDSLLELIRRGEIAEIIAMWKAGLRDEAIAAAQDPEARELITGTTRAHPIHHAVEMGAGTLVLALIDAGADLNARDGEYKATPLDWAHATNKPTIARILQQAGGK